MQVCTYFPCRVKIVETTQINTSLCSYYIPMSAVKFWGKFREFSNSLELFKSARVKFELLIPRTNLRQIMCHLLGGRTTLGNSANNVEVWYNKMPGRHGVHRKSDDLLELVSKLT